MRKIVITIMGFFISSAVLSQTLGNDSSFEMDFQSIQVQDALRIIARQLDHDIILSPQIRGNISLHLHNMTTRQAFDYLLYSRGLGRMEEDRVWVILPIKDLILQKQTAFKLDDIDAATARLYSRVWQIKYAKAADISRLIDNSGHSLLSKRGFIHVDERTNQLYLRDIKRQMDLIEKLILRMDIPIKQVLIKARLASVDEDFEEQLGVHYSLLDGNTAKTENGNSLAGRYSLAVAKLADGSWLDVQLAALDNSGHGDLISSPSLFTANQQPAYIESGEEIPYQEVSRSGGTAVVFKKAVLSLKVTPEVLPGNKVLLQLQVNQDRPSSRIVQGVPAITTRQMSTHILVKNGQTIVLGGIYETNKEDNLQRVPFLSKLPGIGILFQQKNHITNKRELLIFVTPKIIAN